MNQLLEDAELNLVSGGSLASNAAQIAAINAGMAQARAKHDAAMSAAWGTMVSGISGVLAVGSFRFRH